MSMREQRHPAHITFERVSDALEELDPQYWQQLLMLLEYYIPRELERRGVIPEETPLPIAQQPRLKPRTLH